MAFASDRILREQSEMRKRYEMEQALRRGEIVQVPVEPYMAQMFMDGSTPSQPPAYDEIRYNYNSMTYETRSQSNRIRELENHIVDLQTKKVAKKKREEIDSIISYFYKR